jgi:Brp/Blh family beta-carotene 15,15'-monooxygenase
MLDLPALRESVTESDLSPRAVRHWHRLAFTALAFAIAVPSAFGAHFSLMDFPLVAGAAMLFLGVPHGAFDVALAHRRWEIGTPRTLTSFLALYIGLAAAFAAIWFLLPQLALPVFIAMSGAHFAGDWRRDVAVLPRTVVGLALITAPALLHREPVVEIFAWLVPADVAVTTAEVMAAVAIPLLQAAALIVLVTVWSRAAAALEMTAVLLLAVFATPLVFFVLYWCGLHSLRHAFAVQEELKPRSLPALGRLSLPYAPITILGVVAGALLWPHLDLGQAMLAVLFVSLAALTVPHMLLVDQLAPRRGQVRMTAPT